MQQEKKNRVTDILREEYISKASLFDSDLTILGKTNADMAFYSFVSLKLDGFIKFTVIRFSGYPN